MNAGLAERHASVLYYDGDYPSADDPVNFDSTTVFQGIAHDVPRYLEMARETGGPILELCCGSGRVLLPLARAGYAVTGVDLSSELLDQLRRKLSGSETVRLVEQDITQLDLGSERFPLAIVAFNSLLCIPDFAAQRRALEAIARHLEPGGRLVMDLVNPLRLKIDGDPVARPFFTRVNPHTGNTYTRFAMVDPFDEQHRQRLHGWYDELDGEGRVTRRFYSLHWRPIFRHELELMLETAGLSIESIEGGHQHEAYTAQSPRMLVQARRA
ncbi:MAG: class I SAM-dependent methyltransferase [Armatimonadetes bacterium]|nr:class I SAM-dependent methyltransferase [Armatimonadota bacterium]